MQNAKGHARYRSSACGNVASSVFFKSAQVTLCGSQNLSFQNHAKIPAISPQQTPWPGGKEKSMARCIPGGLSQAIWPCRLVWWWDIRPSASPQLCQCREVDSISSSASDWCVEMSCNTVGGRYAGVSKVNHVLYRTFGATHNQTG